ncbi:MAG: hypothetical protein ABTQ29_15055 [Siculibacillus sp.]
MAAVLLALATMLVGFAHRPMPGFPTAEEIVSGAGLAFGNYCAAPSSSDEAGAKIAVERPCPACVLQAAPGLGAVAEIVLPSPEDRVIGRTRVADRIARAVATPTARARGPPVRA